MASNERARDNGFATPTSTDLIRNGDDAISQNARAAVDLFDRAVATLDNLTATAHDLPAGTAATATVTGTYPYKTITIGVPQGEQGVPGMGYAEGQQLLADSQALLTDSEQLVAQNQDTLKLAQEAQAASLEVPDANTAAMIGNPATDTTAALRAGYVQGYNVTAAGAIGDGVADDTAALQAAIDHSAATGQTATVPPGTYNVTGSLYARPGAHLDLDPGAYLRRSFSGPAMITNQTWSEKVNGFSITGSGKIGSDDHTTTGQVLSLYGDDMRLTDFTIDCFAGGQACLIGGDRVRMTNVTITRPAPLAGAGGIRFYGGTNFRAVACHVESGDDALQFTPIWSETPIRDLSISDSYYIGCTGKAYEGRAMVVMLQSSAPIGQGGLTCSVTDVGFTDCTGSGERCAIGVSNTDSTGQAANIKFTGCTVDQTNAPAYGGQDVYVERGTYGPVRGVTFTNVTVVAPAKAAFGTIGDATTEQYVQDVTLTDCTFEAPRSTTATVRAYSVDGLTIRGGNVYGMGAAHVIESAGTTYAARNIRVTDAKIAGVGTGYAGCRFPFVVNYHAVNNRFTPTAGATSGSGLSLSAAATGGVIAGNDFTALPGTPLLGTVAPGTIINGNRGLSGSTSGTATIPEGQLTHSVPHGLGTTPTAVTLGPHSSTPVWVSGRGNNTVTVARAGTSGAVTFDWSATYQP